LGLFPVRVGIAHPTDPGRLTEVELMADTGATLSWVPRAILEPPRTVAREARLPSRRLQPLATERLQKLTFAASWTCRGPIVLV
jgi:hypothetical protein